jgi:hypothetical protein
VVSSEGEGVTPRSFGIVILINSNSPVVRYWRKDFCQAEMEMIIREVSGSKKKEVKKKIIPSGA